MPCNIPCENDFCVYNKDGKCNLEKISMSGMGICEDCINVTLDEKYLDEAKSKQCADMDNR